jgi:hypothetical protein
MGATSELESGVVVIDGDALAPAGTPAETIAYVEAMTPTPTRVGMHGGGRNVAD